MGPQFHILWIVHLDQLTIENCLSCMTDSDCKIIINTFINTSEVVINKDC